MSAFKGLLIGFILVVGVYTIFVILDHGMGLVQIFFGDMAAMTWPGQFNLDFFCMLILSATWTAWRNDFTPLGYGLSAIALFGGIMFLAPYLLFLLAQTDGDMKVVMLGETRAAG